MYSINFVHHLNNKLVFKTIEKKTTKNDQTSKAEYEQRQIWIEFMKKNVHPAKIYYFHFLKVILLFIVVSAVHLILDCVIYTDILWVFLFPDHW